MPSRLTLVPGWHGPRQAESPSTAPEPPPSWVLVPTDLVLTASCFGTEVGRTGGEKEGAKGREEPRAGGAGTVNMGSTWGDQRKWKHFISAPAQFSPVSLYSIKSSFITVLINISKKTVSDVNPYYFTYGSCWIMEPNIGRTFVQMSHRSLFPLQLPNAEWQLIISRLEEKPFLDSPKEEKISQRVERELSNQQPTYWTL